MFTPENQLEAILMKAADDPSARSDFYHTLLESDVFVINAGPLPATTGSHTAQVGEEYHLRHVIIDGQSHLAAFSSLSRLQATLSEPVGYLALNCRTLLELISGTPLVLNPGSDFGKLLTADEIASMLDGSLWSPFARHVVQHETAVQLGQPAVYPQQLVDALVSLFKHVKAVRCAYLAHYFNPEDGEPPHTLIGLEVQGDWDSAVAAIGPTIRSVEVPNPPVDFTRVASEGQGKGKGKGKGLSDYLTTQCEPFYRAKKRLFS